MFITKVSCLSSRLSGCLYVQNMNSSCTTTSGNKGNMYIAIWNGIWSQSSWLMLCTIGLILVMWAFLMHLKKFHLRRTSMAAPMNVSKWMSLVHHALYEMSVSSELGQCLQKSNGKSCIKGIGLKLISMAYAMMVARHSYDSCLDKGYKAGWWCWKSPMIDCISRPKFGNMLMLMIIHALNVVPKIIWNALMISLRGRILASVHFSTW